MMEELEHSNDIEINGCKISGGGLIKIFIASGATAPTRGNDCQDTL